MTSNDALLRRKLGGLSLAAITFSNMLGSGWLFAAYYAAKLAGPLSLLSWVIAGIATSLIAVVFVELGLTRPLSGGNVRWPHLASGPFVGALVGWIAFLQVAIGAPSEAAGLLQYGQRWWPGLFDGEELNGLGLLVAVAVMVGFAAVNYFGVTLLARVNNAITVGKVLIPFVTVALFIAAGFDTANLSETAGFAPYGTASALSAVIGGGLIYAFGGIHSAATLSGEARDPRRDVARGTFLGFGLAFVLYLGLQAALIGAVPQSLLGDGWQGLNFHSPFAQLAVLVNLTWLSWLLLADAVVSPAGSLFVGIGINTRVTYGLAQNGVFPPAVGTVHPRSGIPRRALALNIAVAAVCLLLFGSWHALVSALGVFFAVGYAAISVAVMVFRRTDGARPWARGLPVIAPASFVISVLITYWSGWQQMRTAIVLFLLALPLYALRAATRRDRLGLRAVRHGLWLCYLMLFVAAVSYVGSFGGHGLLAAPWDSLLVGAAALGFYHYGVRAGLAWQRERAAAPGPGDEPVTAPDSGAAFMERRPRTKG
ncbi:APC family permease [Streptomyces sp. NPDC003077]|uniref:APC family permease n=1 Tax=Streptomyces sp. NPDC003077 TaxID=3154443 RepID=UPI0033BED428